MQSTVETPSKFTIGLIQLALSDNTEENLTKAVNRIEDAVKRGAQVICLPELFRSRYFCQKEDFQNFNLAETIPGPSTDALCKIAKKHKVVIVVPLFEKERTVYIIILWR